MIDNYNNRFSKSSLRPFYLLIPLAVLVVALLVGLNVGKSQGISKKDYQINFSAVNQPIEQVDEISNSRQNAITRAVAAASPTVVGINVTSVRTYYRRSPFFDDPFFRQFFGDEEIQKKVQSLGSGFIVSPDGYIITNQHVVENALEIIVTREGGRQYVAEKIGEDITSDVALLKIDGKDLPYARLGNSDDVIIGEWAIALGNPFGLFDISSKPTVTVGVISAVDQDFGRQEDRVYEDMIQTDAAINGGNSGGPLVNSQGEVIGMNAWIISGSETMSANIGLGFAIPINRVKRVFTDLLNYGRVDRSFWTGIHYDVVTPNIARYLGLKTTRGAIVSEIDNNSPAEKAGLEVGDVIFAINGRDINNFNDITTIIDNLDLKAGDALEFRIYRPRRFLTIRVKLAPIQDKYNGKS
jgi:serine protease Do